MTGIFAIIAKITVDSENLNFCFALIFRYDSEFSLSYRIFAMIGKISVHSKKCLLLFLIQTTLIFCFSHFYPHCNYSSMVILVFHMFVRLYKSL